MRNYKKWTLILLLVLLIGGITVGVNRWNKNRTSSDTKTNSQVSENGEPRLVVQLGHSGGISSAVYSPNGKFIVSGGIDDKVAILWEASTGREIRRFIGHTNQINSVAFSPDSKFVLTGSGQGEFEAEDSKIANDYTTRLWDITNGIEVRKFEGHTGAVNSVAFSPDGKFILTGSDDKTARLWDSQTGKEIKKLSHLSSVKSVAYSPNNQFILAGGGGDWSEYPELKCENCVANLWETTSWKVVKTFQGYTRPVGSVAFSYDSRFALLGTITPEGSDETPDENTNLEVSKYDLTTGLKVRAFKGFAPAIFSPDSRFVITAGAGSKNAGVQIWDANTGERIRYINGYYDIYNKEEAGVAQSLAISPDNASILISFDTIKGTGSGIMEFGEKSICIFDFKSARKQLSLQGNTAKRSNTELVGGDVSSEVGNFIQFEKDVWNKSNGTKVSFEGIYKDTVLTIPRVMSGDGNLALMGIFTGSDVQLNGTIGIWETNTGNLVNRIKNDGYGAWFTPDNKFVLLESISDELDGGFLLSFYEVRTGKLKWKYNINILVGGLNGRNLRQNGTYSTLSPDGRLVYILFPNQDPEMEDARTGEIIKPSGENELLVIETESGKVIKRIQTPKQDVVQGIRVSPDGRFIAFKNDTQNRINILASDSGKLLYQIGSKNLGWIDGVFSPDSKLMATQTSDDNSVASLQVWSLLTGKIIREFPQVKFGTLADLKFSPDNTKLLITYGYMINNTTKLFDLSTGKEMYRFEQENVTSNAFSQDGRYAMTSSEGGYSRIWSLETGRELCQLSSFQNGDWIVTTPDGRFDTNNLDKVEGMHWIMPGEPLRPLPIEIFMRQYYEPKLLARVLRCNENKNCEQEFKPLPALNTLNRTQPDVKIADIKPDSDNTVEVTVEVANAKSEGQKDTFGNPLESGVNDVHVFRDGQLVAYAPKNAQLEQSTWEWVKSWFVGKSESNGKVELDKEGKATLKFSKIKLPHTGIDKLEFSAYAFNTDQIKSETSRQTYAIKPNTVKGRAYIVSLGVNATNKAGSDLRFAANDARQTQETLGKNLREQGQYEEVVNIPLISDFTVSVKGQTIAAKDATLQQVQTGQKTVTENTATKAHFKAVIDILAGRKIDTNLLKTITNADKLRTANPEDLIIISVSSHGFADKDGIFYLVPSDSSTASVNSADFRQKAISSDELSLWLRDVDGGEMALIIDACHSASAVESADFKPAPMNSRGLGQLSYDKGMRILTATQADNVALETNKTRQGLLSYALLQNGLNDFQADFKPRDRIIVMSEWLNFGVQRVPRLYEEAKSGQVKVVRETVDTETEEKTQQPSLFDFSRRKQDATLEKRGGSVPTKPIEISPVEKKVEPISAPMPNSTPDGFNGRVIKNRTVIVRASDSQESAELGRVYLNDPIKIGIRKDKFYRVTTESGLEGWIHGNSLERVK